MVWSSVGCAVIHDGYGTEVDVNLFEVNETFVGLNAFVVLKKGCHFATLEESVRNAAMCCMWQDGPPRTSRLAVAGGGCCYL